MLVNVHTSLDLAAPAEGENERVFVRGSYEYHHYGQVQRVAHACAHVYACMHITRAIARTHI